MSRAGGDADRTAQSTEEREGGWGWVIAVAAFFVNILTIGCHNVFGLLLMDLVEEFDESVFKTSLIGSIDFGCILIFGPLGGACANSFGSRPTAVLGVLILSSSLLISSYASTLDFLFYSYGIGFGLGTSLCYVQGIVMVSKYFTTQRAMATGIVFCGSALGTLVVSPLYQLTSTYLTWRQTLRVMSAFSFLSLLCVLTYRPFERSTDKKSTLEERVNKSPARGLIVDLALWKNVAFIIWAISIGLFKLGYLVPYVHVVKHCEDIGAPENFGSLVLVVLGLTTSVGRLIFGRLADSPKVNRLYVSQASAFITGLANLILPSMPSPTGLIIYSIVIGLMDGGVEILLPVMTLDLVGSEKMTIAWGCLLAVISFSGLGPPIAGALRDAQGDYSGAFYFAGAPMIVSSLVLILIPTWAKKQHQEPALSFLSIDPSKLDLSRITIPDDNKPAGGKHEKYNSPQLTRPVKVHVNELSKEIYETNQI